MIKINFKNTIKAFKNTLKSQQGLTLIEILIVVTILASLVAILGNQVVKRLEASRVSQTKIQIAEIEKQLDLYNLDCYRYPTTEQGLEALIDAGATNCNNWNGPYMRALPKDAWNNEFDYYLDGSTPVIISYGADGREGGDGHDRDLSNLD